ncbi:MAG TPA: ADOP family duplicated permease [Thermoanaerobaculia bacterium]|nr:ADOP family duplicated permease [Thermoanaerobaculia bacterium]
MRQFLSHLGYGARLVLRQPGFSLLVLLSMAAGLGVLTATFSLLNAVLLQPLPYAGVDRLLSLQSQHPEMGTNLLNDAATLALFEREARTLDGIAAAVNLDLRVETPRGVEPVKAARASRSFFEVFSTHPLHGRLFTEADGRPGDAPVAVIDYRFWRDFLGADPGVLGKALRVSGGDLLGGAGPQGDLLTVVGVLPEAFKPPFANADPQIWIAARFDEANPEENHLLLYARLREGTALPGAEAELAGLYARLERSRDPQSQWRLRLLPLKDALTGSVRRPVQFLFLAGLATLLTAAANTANLLSARARTRRREAAVRTLLGASRRQILGQLFAEGLVFAVPAGVIGLALAHGGLRLFRALGMVGVPRRFAVEIDGTVLAVAAAATLGVGVFFALVPALGLSRAESSGLLRAAASPLAAPPRPVPTRMLFVSLQVAAALAAAIVSALLLRSFVHLLRIDPGFDPRGVVTAWISLPESSYPGPLDQAGLYNRLRERLEAMPDSAEAGLVNYLPMSLGSGAAELTIEAPSERLDSRTAAIEFRAVSPGYLEALKIPLLAGRSFDERDLANPTFIVSQRAARELWGGQDPLGQRLLLGGTESGNPWMPVIGVVGDVRHDSLTEEGQAVVYMPYLYFPQMAIALRTQSGDVTAAKAALSRIVREIDPGLPVFDVQPMEDRVGAQRARSRMTAWLMAILALTTLLLAGAGVYGASWYTVAEREDEARIRFALGAVPSDLVSWMGRKVLPWILGGLAAGLGLSLALSRSLSALLFGIEATDPATLLLITALVGAIAGASVYTPTKARIRRLDPSASLRASDR